MQERVLRKAAQMLYEDHQKSISGNADTLLLLDLDLSLRVEISSSVEQWVKAGS